MPMKFRVIMYVIFVLTSAFLKINCAINSTKYTLYTNVDIWHRFSEQFREFSKVSRVQCVGYCDQDPDCLSVNYNKDLQVCELNGYRPLENSTNYVPEAGWKAFYIEHVETDDPMIGATAWQSLTSAWGTADLALDGNTATHFFSRSCSHTKSGDSWWAMAMQYEVPVRRIVVYLRSDCCPERNMNLQFLVCNTREDVENNIGTMCATFAGPPVYPTQPQTIICDSVAVGKYLKVIQGDNLSLSICEIYVHSD